METRVDLVERLRFTANAGVPDFTNSKLLDEAADEIERLREIVKDDPDRWSFDALMFMAKRILAEVYPADVFTGETAAKPGNEGTMLVIALRKVIAEIEAKG